MPDAATPSNTPYHNIDSLSKLFLERSYIMRSGESLLYERLSRDISGDSKILSIAARARTGQDPPYLLFATVHYLLLKGATHPLASFYRTTPSFDASKQGLDPFPDFRSFCLNHEEEIVRLISTRTVQYQKPNRCAILLPALQLVARHGKSPLSMIEIGASAGLNLLWDSYGYSYSNGFRCGVHENAPLLTCQLKGMYLPPLPTVLPKVAFRIGVDLYPVDLDNTDSLVWLRSFVNPDHTFGAELLDTALKVAQSEKPEVKAGDAVELLPALLREAPENSTICVMNSYLFLQLSQESIDSLRNTMLEFSREREVFQISLERVPNTDFARLELIAYRKGKARRKELARCSSSGEWMEWGSSRLLNRVRHLAGRILCWFHLTKTK